MTLVSNPGHDADRSLIGPVPWLSNLCCPESWLSLYRLPHVARLELPGRSSPWVAAFTPQLAVIHRGFAAGLAAPPQDAVRDFMARLLTAAVPRYRNATVGALREWCALPRPARSMCGPPCGGTGLVQIVPPVVCPRCGGYGVGEDRTDGYGWIGGVLVDRRELARVLEHLAPAERVDLGVDEGGDLWLCGDVCRVLALGLPAWKGEKAPKFGGEDAA